MKRVICLILTLIAVLNCLTLSGFAAGTGVSAKITSITAADPDTKNVTVARFQSRKLYISVLPKGAENNVSWSVADKSVAVVSQDGTVTGKNVGNTTVTVTSTDGSKKSVTYKVTVTARKDGNSLSTDSCTVVNTQKTAYPYGQLCKDIKGLKQKYPYIFDYVSLGTSYDNRQIFELIIGNKNSKNKIFVQATVHAREYINSVLVMKQAEALCENYYSGTYRGKYYSELLENCCFYIIPMSNPDGVSISIYGADGIRDDALRSKVVKMCNKYGSGKRSYYTLWKANARGVDLNRNWDCNWATSKNTVNYACSSGYKGPSAFSEKETKILKNEVETLQPKTVISYHSNGSYIYWDFIQTGTLQRKCSDLFNVVKGLTGYYSAENPSAHGYDTSELSPCFGDWVAQVKKTPTLTIETGRVSCPIPAKYFSTIWNENKHVLPAVSYFVLNDTAINISSLTTGSKSFSLTAKQVEAKNFTYQVEYSEYPNFKNAGYVEFESNVGSLKISSLKANQKYFVRIRTVKKYGITKIYGKWSAVKTVQTKK